MQRDDPRGSAALCVWTWCNPESTTAQCTPCSRPTKASLYRFEKQGLLLCAVPSHEKERAHSCYIFCIVIRSCIKAERVGKDGNVKWDKPQERSCLLTPGRDTNMFAYAAILRYRGVRLQNSKQTKSSYCSWSWVEEFRIRWRHETRLVWIYHGVVLLLRLGWTVWVTRFISNK